MEDFSDVTNLDLYRHFAKDLLVASENAATISKKLPSNEHMSQNLFAFDFSDGKAALKAYFFPILKSLETGISEGRLICDSILKLDIKEYPVAPALALVEAYVASRENLRVETLSFDCNEPRDSRIKVYLRTPYTSFRHVSDIYTLGGRLKDTTTVAGVEILRELWPLLLDVPADYANDDPLPPNDHRTAGFGFNFEIRPGKTYPEPKVYIPVKHYGKTDMAVAEGLATYFRRQGWNDLANSYPKDLRLRLSVFYVYHLAL
jgi:tryptophan 7-dimethylallyltransferase